MDSRQLQQLLDAQQLLVLQQARAAAMEAGEAPPAAAAARAPAAPDPPSSSQQEQRYQQHLSSEPRSSNTLASAASGMSSSSVAALLDARQRSVLQQARTLGRSLPSQAFSGTVSTADATSAEPPPSSSTAALLGMSPFHSRSANATAGAGALPSQASRLTDYDLLQALQHSTNPNDTARLLLLQAGAASPLPDNTASLQALLQSLNPPPVALAPSTSDVHSLLLSLTVRQNEQKQQQQRQASNSVLETLRLRAALLGGGGGFPPAQPHSYGLGSLLHGQQQQQQLLAQSSAVNQNSANAQLTSLLMDALAQQQRQVPVAVAAARAEHPDPPVAAPSVAAAATAATAKEIEISEEEEAKMLIPDLPGVRPLPPLEEGNTEHFSKRSVFVPLATDEDSNWLSERQVFIRAELLEVVRASHQDVLVRSSSKSVAYEQVGIRCRFCAHLHPSARSMRSSAYPSSIRQMYQSFTMMVRDHWAGCKALPPKLQKRFMAYQEHKIPSSSLSREYWSYAARKIGMVDAEFGITITEDSMKAAIGMLSFGTTPEHVQAMELQGKEQDELHDALTSSDQKPKAKEAQPKQGQEQKELLQLLHPCDKETLSPYLFFLMTQVTPCYLLETEQVGKRKAAPVGLSGFGCKHCISKGRLGFCRVFPLNKRSMPTKVNDVYSHIQRCSLTPPATRALLRKLKREALQKAAAAPGVGSAAAARLVGDIKGPGKLAERDREFVDQIWTKLGRKGFQI